MEDRESIFHTRSSILDVKGRIMEEVKATSFEGSLKELEEAVERLESGNLPLGDALKYFEAGLKASNVCRERLEEAKQRVDVLIKESGGGLDLTPFEEDDASDEEAPF